MRALRAGCTLGFAIAAVGLWAVPVRAADAPPLTEPSASASAKPAASSSDDAARAQALFDEAVELAQSGNFEAACTKLEQSLALHDGIGTSFHLAGCWQKIGRTASAYRLFEKVASKAHALGQPEREQAAASRRAAIEPKLSRLRIDVETRGPQTEVYLDEALVPESDWKKPVPVDRGSHRVRVAAEGKKPWQSEVVVDVPGATLAVLVPPLADAESPKKETSPLVAVPTPVAKRPAATRPEKVEAATGSGQRWVALGVGGVGAAALAFGIFEGFGYLRSNDKAKEICPASTNCIQDDIARHEAYVDDAKKERTLAFVGVGVGGAAIAAATYLYLSVPSHAEPSDERRSASRLRVAPLLGGGTYGAGVLGSF